MSKILITGGAGFIMSHAVDSALNNGHEVVNIDAMLEGSCEKNFNPNVETFRTYVEDYDATFDIVSNFDPDVVIHGASLSNVDTSLSDPLLFTYNYQATASLLEALKNIDFQGVFLQIGTDEEYGAFDYSASSEAESGGFTEKSTVNPTSVYAVSKAASTYIALSYFKQFGMKVRVSRCSNNYGTRQQDKLIPTIFKKLHLQEKIPIFKSPARRNWLHVSDHVAAMWHIIEHGEDGEVYNVSSNENYSPKEVVEIIIGESNAEKHIEYVPDRVGYDLVYKINSQKLRNLGWAPKTKLVEQIPDMVDYYLQAYSEGWFSNA